jgi:adenylate cyclase
VSAENRESPEGPELSDADVAALAGVTVERLHELGRHGIVAPGDGGVYRLGDVMRVEVATATERAGISIEDLAAAVASGALSLEYLNTLPPPRPFGGRRAAELAAAYGVAFERVRDVIAAFGLPPPEPDDRVREDDEIVYAATAGFLGIGLAPEAFVAAARIFGEALRHLAQYQGELFHNEFERAEREAGTPEGRLLEVVMAAGASDVVDYGPALVQYLFTRHAESYNIQHRLEHAEAALEEAGVHRRAPRDPPAIAFLDVTGYTALTERFGDDASAELAMRLATFVERPVREHQGHVVKWLGDGVELFFASPPDAVSCALSLARESASAGLPPLHIGINVGPVVYRGGDYYGRVVNIAARIASVAEAGEVVVSSSVVDACAGADVAFRPHGEHALKGVDDTVPLFGASEPA